MHDTKGTPSRCDIHAALKIAVLHEADHSSRDSDSAANSRNKLVEAPKPDREKGNSVSCKCVCFCTVYGLERKRNCCRRCVSRKMITIISIN